MLDSRAANGESPTWSCEEQALYWIDVKEPALHRLQLVTGQEQSWTLPAEVGAFALCRSGRALVALRTGIELLDVQRNRSELVAEPAYDPRHHRFNDGKVDARGRFWVGTMYEPLDNCPGASEPADRAGPLCRFDLATGLARTPATAVISNGLAWSPDGRLLYFTDTDAGEVRCFDFDADNGAISNPRAFASFTSKNGNPDGASVDVEGCYWVALFGAGRVVRIRPSGEIDRTISLPVTQPTMCSFGGPDLDVLFINSARSGLDQAQLAREPLAGGVFQCRPGVSGLLPERFAD